MGTLEVPAAQKGLGLKVGASGLKDELGGWRRVGDTTLSESLKASGPKIASAH